MCDDEFERWLAAARTGDEAAFTAVFRTVQPMLLRYLSTMARGLAGSSAEDIASQTWLQVVRGLDRFAGDRGGFTAWVFTIARARLVDARRQARMLPVPTEDDALEGASAAEPDPAEVVEGLFTTESALATVRLLPAAQAEVLLLRYVAGLDVEHTARVLGKRPGTVRVTAHRGLRRLGRLLTAATAEDGVTRSASATVRDPR